MTRSRAQHSTVLNECTPKERASFSQLLAPPFSYADCFRTLHPEAEGCFSYWSTRSGNQLLNRGLRLDYAVASARTRTLPLGGRNPNPTP